MMFLILTGLYFVKTTLMVRRTPVLKVHIFQMLFVTLHDTLTLRPFIAPSDILILHVARVVARHPSHRDKIYIFVFLILAAALWPWDRISL
jgi:hypothetical protein